MKVISISCFFAMVLLFSFSLTGCQENSTSGISDEQARLVASENIELKKELAIQKKLLAQCQKANAELEVKLKKASQKQGTQIIEMFEAMKKKEE